MSLLPKSFEGWLSRGLVVTAFFASANSVFAQPSLELEEACTGDIGLFESIVQIIEHNSFNPDYMTEQEADQIRLVLAELDQKENAPKTLAEKAQEVVKACSDYRILQERNNHIVNPN